MIIPADSTDNPELVEHHGPLQGVHSSDRHVVAARRPPSYRCI